MPAVGAAAGPEGQGGRSAEGVDEAAGKEHLHELAERLGLSGRSRMTRPELLEAPRKANRSRTRQASN